MGGELNTTYSGSTSTLPGELSAEGELGVDGDYGLQVGGLGLQLHGEASIAGEISEQGGMVTVEMTATVSVSAEASAKTGAAGVEASASESYEITYTVTMPAESFDLETARSLDPGDPLTWPIGTEVSIEEDRQSERGLEVAFRGISLGNNVQQDEGSSMMIERTGETTVRVTTGSTEGVNAVNSMGYSLGPGSVSLSNDTTLNGSTVTTVEFDLSTEEGRAQYDYYVANGELMPPADPNATGIVSMQQTERLDFESVSMVNASLGPFSVDLESPSVVVNSVQVTDMQTGESTVVTSQDHGNGTPLVITQQFDAQGNEDLAARTYSTTVDVTEDNVDMLNAISGGSFIPGGTVQITFTHPELEEYIDTQVNPAIDSQTEEGGTVTGNLSELRRDIEAPEVTPASFMKVLTQNHGQDSYAVVDMLWDISALSDGDYTNGSNSLLPASVTEVDEPATEEPAQAD